MAFYPSGTQHQRYPGEFYDQQFGGVGHQTLLGSSPTQMETSAYLPGYLLGGPGSPSPKSPQRQRQTPYVHPYSTQHTTSNMTPVPMSIAPAVRNIRFTGESRKSESKPGGPPVQSLHEHTISPARTFVPLFAAGNGGTPERKQLTFTCAKTVRRFNTVGTHSPTVTPGSNTHPNTSITQHSPPSPTQMDPFYTQGEELTSDDSYNEYWITVFGFPAASTSYILEQFSQYGTIIKHQLAAEGNWMHIQYHTKLQAKKALSKNGKVFGDGIMVGVQACVDKAIIQEHCSPVSLSPTDQQPSTSSKRPSTMRPLIAAYQASSSTHEVSPTNPNTPQKSSGFVSRTMEYIFGW